ncbi:MAG: 2Fe-2S iron-sulfur cluster binding domain-containing protein [Gammaproteobacteria bacterium]|nr:2Fe-2S iron-sulfur cluster binding domain-containing protein [Gammaproteobacteria bacterium]
MKPKTSKEIVSFRAILDGVNHNVSYSAGAILLDSMLADGLDPAFQCMSGNCGTCMVKLVRGDIEMKKTKALSQRDLDQGYILLCQSVAKSDNVQVDCDE